LRDELNEPLGTAATRRDPVRVGGTGVLIAVAALVAALVLGEAASLRLAAPLRASVAALPAQRPVAPAPLPPLRLVRDLDAPPTPAAPAAPVVAEAPAEKPAPPEAPKPGRVSSGAPQPLIIDVQQALAALRAQDSPAERR
jgi:hypothetical protein